MRGRCSLKYLTKRLFVIGILAMVPLLVVSGCVLADRLERSFNDTPQEVPKELEIVWETWKLLSDEYITQAELDEAKLSAGAIQGMLEALGDPAPDFLTPDRYQLDAPNLGAIWQVWEILVEEYGGSQELDARLLSEAAIQGMLETLSDRFTEYISPAAYSLQTDDYSAAFEGIGAHVNIIDGRLTIVAPIPDTPAEQAGLAAGDVILAVDGESIQALDLAEAVLKVRGRKGTPVELLVVHPEETEPEIITIVRGRITPPSVVWELLPEGTAYLGISQFVQETEVEVAEALQEIAAQDARGLVLDLRRNVGGLLDATVGVASEFLSEGLVLYQIDNRDQRTDSEVHGGGRALEIPMVVLVDAFSASGAEVLAGALQDHERAVLIGTGTFGKGSVNILRELSDGSAIHLTFALWYTPQGRLIEGQGLSPDIVVPMDLRIPLGSQLDIQLAVAREVIQNQFTVATS